METNTKVSGYVFIKEKKVWWNIFYQLTLLFVKAIFLQTLLEKPWKLKKFVMQSVFIKEEKNAEIIAERDPPSEII